MPTNRELMTVISKPKIKVHKASNIKTHQRGWWSCKFYNVQLKKFTPCHHCAPSLKVAIKSWDILVYLTASNLALRLGMQITGVHKSKMQHLCQ